ncbi:C25 family cysteine peptidase [Fulvivirgaceae bacterium BMA10]|uniref:C25 family cysteine peptidase n=1 Tax=Splendidivirga corallicola TaxID=3051826 RepID=A0ABT8KK82_9BACT|nr:C25 family cysteine peptidase [Fulvivirgaceae bacterium BMA10]
MKFSTFLLAHILFGLQVFSQNNSIYHFQAPNEGVYKIKRPDSIDPDGAIIVNNDLKYLPCYDPIFDGFYIYSPNKNTYQLRNLSNGDSTHIEFQSQLITKNKTHFKYSISNTLNVDHWFHHILREDQTFKQTIKLPKPLGNGLKDSIRLKVHNFVSANTPLFLKLNGKDYQVKMTQNRDYVFEFEFSNIDGVLEIELFLPFNEIGIISLEMDISNREIFHGPSFTKGIYIPSKRLDENFDFRHSYKYFFFLNNELNAISSGKEIYQMAYNNVLIQNENHLKELALKSHGTIDTSYYDFLVITTSMLLEPTKKHLLPLLQNIRPELTYHLIDAQPIYDHLSYSKKSNTSIKKFLHSIKPKYVLFVGDSNMNDRNSNDLIPTFYYLQSEKNSRIATDYPYAYSSDPLNPVFQLGRLPMESPEEIITYTKKLKKYLQNTNDKTIIFDDEQLLANPISSAALFQPEHHLFNKIFGDDIIDKINQNETGFLIYAGHASFSGWSNYNKVESGDFDKLHAHRIFKLLDLSCWTGEFAHRSKKSFSEDLLLLEDKGAIGIISSSGFSSLKGYTKIIEYYHEHRKLDYGTFLNSFKVDLFLKGHLNMDDIHAFNLLGIPSL